MKFSLRSKLSLSYVLVALVCVLLISILMNNFLEKQFQDYIIKNQERKSNEIVQLISRQFREKGTWDDMVIENIGVNALEQGMIVKVRNSAGETVWDATVHNNGMCMQMIEHMSRNMMSYNPNWQGGYMENTHPVVSDFKNVGTVQIGYYGPYYFNDTDLAFISALNNVLLVVGGISLLLALLTGTLMAKRLSQPISRVITTARMISKGYYDARVAEKSSTKEIGQLTDTVNDLAETLGKQEVLRKRLTGDVAHELRTPLATLQSHLEAMIDGIWAADADRLKSCHEEVIRINGLVGELERLAHYESEKLVLNRTRFDASELIRQILKSYEIEFLNKNIKIEFIGKEEILLGDRDKISQALINLVSNAAKYTPEGGQVQLGVSGDGCEVTISVRDNGAGIPEEDIPFIFERFYRADKSRNRMTGGSGIGLTIAKSLIEAHKGRVTVQSKVGEGTEFRVIIPKGVKE